VFHGILLTAEVAVLKVLMAPGYAGDIPSSKAREKEPKLRILDVPAVTG